MKKLFFTSIILLFLLILPVRAEALNGDNLAGYILLQVESRGEAWYVNPADQKRYYLSRPEDALRIMSKLGLGVRHDIISGNNFPSRLKGRILLDVDDKGKAYYIYPKDSKAYYLGRPADAFAVMKNLGLGITNTGLGKIAIGYLSVTTIINIPPASSDDCSLTNAYVIVSCAAKAIMNNDKTKALTFFTDDYKKRVEYTLNFYDSEGNFTFGNFLAGMKLNTSNENELVYSNQAYFSLNGKDVEFKVYVTKQSDGTWKISSL